MAADGKIGTELAKRIGTARGDFKRLQAVWKHSNLPRKHKLDVYRSLIESRLMYSSCTAVLRKAELRRLDGFQDRCLRKWGILPAFMSQTSNETVLQIACDAQVKLCRISNSFYTKR